MVQSREVDRIEVEEGVTVVTRARSKKQRRW
jgi:hypothetical protein